MISDSLPIIFVFVIDDGLFYPEIQTYYYVIITSICCIRILTVVKTKVYILSHILPNFLNLNSESVQIDWYNFVAIFEYNLSCRVSRVSDYELPITYLHCLFE